MGFWNVAIILSPVVLTGMGFLVVLYDVRKPNVPGLALTTFGWFFIGAAALLLVLNILGAIEAFKGSQKNEVIQTARYEDGKSRIVSAQSKIDTIRTENAQLKNKVESLQNSSSDIIGRLTQARGQYDDLLSSYQRVADLNVRLRAELDAAAKGLHGQGERQQKLLELQNRIQAESNALLREQARARERAEQQAQICRTNRTIAGLDETTLALMGC